MISLSEWTLWEIEYEREGGSVDRPVTEELLWRLYFSVIDPQRRILLLLAVAKKKWKRNPNDLAKASRRLGDYQDGRARSCEVRLDD